MKNFALGLILLLISCSGEVGSEKKDVATNFKTHPEWAKKASMYELNVRQFTPEGTFVEAVKHLPRLKELGVDVLWVMPIQKIGVLNRKGSLGSYYAIQDYCSVNPEFGNEADFKTFVDVAHKLGMKVILDWVANHTAPDHAWTTHKDWHMRDSLGQLIVRNDWTDIAELNYDNPEMRAEMVKSMGWWIDTFDIDGFRCDVAYEVPTDFWNDAIVELKGKKEDIFMLAEAEVPELTEKAFDMYYGWDLHHILNAVAKEKIGVDSLWRYFEKADTTFSKGAIRLNFISNHDENSWSGTEYERMGDAVEAMSVFTFVVPGMPLIYTGQEAGLNKRLRFFDKDTVDFASVDQHKMTKLYKKLNALKDKIPVIDAQPEGAKMVPIEHNQDGRVFAFKRFANESVDGKPSKMIAGFNMSNEVVRAVFEDEDIYGTWTQFSDGETIVVEDSVLTMQPWQYFILIK